MSSEEPLCVRPKDGRFPAVLAGERSISIFFGPGQGRDPAVPAGGTGSAPHSLFVLPKREWVAAGPREKGAVPAEHGRLSLFNQGFLLLYAANLNNPCLSPRAFRSATRYPGREWGKSTSQVPALLATAVGNRYMAMLRSNASPPVPPQCKTTGPVKRNCLPCGGYPFHRPTGAVGCLPGQVVLPRWQDRLLKPAQARAFSQKQTGGF